MVHKVEANAPSETTDDITFSQVAGFYSNVFNEFKPKPKPAGAQEEHAQQTFDGSHMD